MSYPLISSSLLLMTTLQLSNSDTCYPGMSCFNKHQASSNSEDLASDLPAKTKSSGPNYMIPVWKERLYDAANNESYTELVSVLNEGGPHSVLIAYQGCKIVNVLSHHKREARPPPSPTLSVAPYPSRLGAHSSTPPAQSVSH